MVRKIVKLFLVKAAFVLALGVFTLTGTALSAETAVISTFSVINYSPYRDGQAPGGAAPSEAQVREDIQILKQYTDEIRIYGMGGLADIILKVCLEEGMNIHISAWLGADHGENWSYGNYLEVKRLIDAAHDARYRGIIKSMVVGSEAIYREDLTPARLLDYINYVKQETAGTGIPVTSAIIYFNWNDELAAAADFIFYHVHPLWEGTHVNDGANRVIQTWEELYYRYPDKNIYIGETGWATSGRTVGAGVPSEENQNYFINDLYTKVKNHPLQDKIRIYFFSAFDEKWKQSSDEGDIGPYWGLFRSDRTPKLFITTIKDNPGPNPKDNLIKNGTFETGYQDWTVDFLDYSWAGNARGTASAGTGALIAEVVSEGNVWWSIQVAQAGIILQQNTDYVLSFDVSSTAHRQIQISVENGSNNGATKYFFETVQVSPDSGKVTYRFTMSESCSSGKIVIGLGKNGELINALHDVTIDNVELTAVE